MGAKFVEAMAKQKLLYTEFKSTPRIPAATPIENSSSGNPPYSPTEHRLLGQVSIECSGGDTAAPNGAIKSGQNGVPPTECDAYINLLQAKVVADEDFRTEALLCQEMKSDTCLSSPTTARLPESEPGTDVNEVPKPTENVLFKN